MWFFKEISKSNFKHRSKKNLENNRNMIIHKILNWDSLAVYLFRKRLLIAFFFKIISNYALFKSSIAGKMKY